MGMSKEELIEAINGTLISNEEKAITADALRNLLTDIVENSGNGSGSGGGGGMTFQMSLETDETGSTVFSVTPEQIANNKEQLDILRQLHDEGKPIPPLVFEIPFIEGGMVASQIMQLGYTYIVWSTAEVENPEMLPEGLILPAVMLDEHTLNGDGTLLKIE